jgi:DNA-binding transcriptional LysR family regulator
MVDSRSGNLRFAYKGSRLKPLRAFCQVARLGSVSRAAEALYLSQPAVTLQLQALERELGVRLLERSGRRLTPTREGELLYELAKPLVEGLDGLAATFREQVRGLDAGELNVAAGSSTILYLLPGIVDAFRQRHADGRALAGALVDAPRAARRRAPIQPRYMPAGVERRRHRIAIATAARRRRRQRDRAAIAAGLGDVAVDDAVRGRPGDRVAGQRTRAQISCAAAARM